MNVPTISVILPAYNAECYICEAVHSILDQSAFTAQIIVVDDGSTDSTRQVVQQFTERVSYIFQPNAGAAAARNTGIAHAHGQFIAFLDADDLWTRDKLALQCAAFEQTAGLDMVFGQVSQFISPELTADEQAALDCPAAPMPGYHAGAMLIRAESLHRVGGFSSTWQAGEFIDWYGRARDVGLCEQMLPHVVMLRRLHSANQMRLKPDAVRDYARLLKATLDRRRQRVAGDQNNSG